MTAVVKEFSKQWAFAAVVLCLAAAGAWKPLATAPGGRPPPAAPDRAPHRPSPAATDAPIRDPFVTGSEWRARLREKLQLPFARASAAPPAAAPVEQEPALLGTWIAGSQRFAVLPGGHFPEGAVVGRHRIVTVELDQVVFSVDGRRIVVKVPGRSAVSSARTTAVTEP